MNGKNKTWLQQSLQQIDEIDKLVQENEGRIIENAESTEEEVEKVAEAVKLARDLKDKLNTYKRKIAGDMNQRTNNNKNFQDKVRVITTAFEELKNNLEETKADSDLRKKNEELQQCQSLSDSMNENIATLKLQAAELAKTTAYHRIQKLEQVTNAIDMKAVSEAKNIVSENRATSDTKIVLQTHLAQEVHATAQKLNDLGFPWLNNFPWTTQNATSCCLTRSRENRGKL